MRIAIIMDGLGGGGAEWQSIIAANELARRGHHVCMICYGQDKTHLDSLNQTEVQFVRIRSKGPLRLGRILAIAHHLRRGRFDVVHCFHHPPCIWGGLAAILAGSDALFFGHRGQGNLPRSQRLLLRVASLRARAWIVNSQAVSRHLESYLNVPPERIRVVHNGLTEEKLNSPPTKTATEVRAELDLAAESPLVILVGNLRAVKNIEMFLRVARRVVDAGSEAEFVVAGEGIDFCLEVFKFGCALLRIRLERPDLKAAAEEDRQAERKELYSFAGFRIVHCL